MEQVPMLTVRVLEPGLRADLEQTPRTRVAMRRESNWRLTD